MSIEPDPATVKTVGEIPPAEPPETDEVSEEELLALARSPAYRSMNIPILSPAEVTHEDTERLYLLTDEAMLGKDADGWHVTVSVDSGAVERVLKATRQAGFVTPLDRIAVP